MGIYTLLASLAAAKKGKRRRGWNLVVAVSKSMFARNEVSLLVWAEEEMAACLRAV